MTFLISAIAILSLISNGIFTWYIKRLLSFQEDVSIELAENIYAFQDSLEKLLDTDVLSGEPTLVKLLEDVKEFGISTEEIRLKLIPNKFINEEEEA